MYDEILAYMQYFSKLGEIKKPEMPSFDLSAYTDSEYLLAVKNINFDYEKIDDLNLTINYLKGDWWTFLVAKFIMQI